jgi:hypothetical protein
MSLATPVVEKSTLGLHALEDYAPLIGALMSRLLEDWLDVLADCRRPLCP